MHIIAVQGKADKYKFCRVIRISLKKKSVFKVGIRLKKVRYLLNKHKPFERKLLSFLRNHAFYSIDEFLSS
jgi:hypothetical protein